jgi:prepilin-type N-terminal cleavage/methylation domain-containing protein
MNKKKFKHKEKGFTLIEVLVASVITVILAGGILSLVLLQHKPVYLAIAIF